MANIVYGSVLGYNTQLGVVPQGWADFFDIENFPGLSSLPDEVTFFFLEVALVADGDDPADLYPIDVERALAKLDTKKDNIIWWESGAQAQEHLAEGEAVMGMIWNDRIQTAIDEGASLAIQWNQHITLADYWAVPKDAPNRRAAMQFIAFAVSDQQAHKIADTIPYGPTNINTCNNTNPEMAPFLPTYEDRLSLGFVASDAWWDENKESVSERWNAWLLE